MMQNLLYVEEVDTPNRFGGIGYLGFKKLTFVPIQVRLRMCAKVQLTLGNFLHLFPWIPWFKSLHLIIGDCFPVSHSDDVTLKFSALPFEITVHWCLISS